MTTVPVNAQGGWLNVEGQSRIMRLVRRIPEGLLILLALPAYQLWHIAKYANTHKGRAAKIGVFVSFLPLIAICSVIWGFLWAMILWQLWRDFN